MTLLDYGNKIQFFCYKCMAFYAEEESKCTLRTVEKQWDGWSCECPICKRKNISRSRFLEPKSFFKETP